MRKQTKVVAVASAAALMAIGASMTSFAAGWQEEAGEWFFYDADENRVEDTWKKSGENWFWLDGEEAGAMATEKLIEDDDDLYYVDANGAMVRNTWIAVVNEDQDDDEDPAEYNWYYFQNNGKAYKASENTTSTRFRTIDGKRYAFDDDGKMLYGWVRDGERQSDEDGWQDAVYYLGDWNDGAMKTGWQKVYVYDADEDDDMEHWFHFKSNGQKRIAAQGEVKEDKINGRRYGFDDRGVMVYEWTLATNANATGSSTSDWKYFNNPEDGARVTKGWFKVVAPSEDNDNVFKSNYGNKTFATGDANDENERWYYANGDGNLAVGEIKKIKGKYYGFRPEGSAAGAMLNGLVLMEVNPTDGKILTVIDDGVDADELDDLLSDNTASKIYQNMHTKATNLNNVSLFYFGNDEDNDGAMKTGSVSVSLDGDSYNFMFRKSGGAETKGKGLTGVDDNKYIYKYGCRIKAGSDDKYQVVQVLPQTGSQAIDIHAEGVQVIKKSSTDLKNAAAQHTFINDDGETVKYLDLSTSNGMYLVNTSGSIQKSKVAAKDGDDWYFYAKNRAALLYTNNKNMDKRATTTVSEKWDTVKTEATATTPAVGEYVSNLDKAN